MSAASLYRLFLIRARLRFCELTVLIICVDRRHRLYNYFSLLATSSLFLVFPSSTRVMTHVSGFSFLC